jgi:hypothetical protein
MRSNYFEVKDPVAFEAFCSKWALELIRGGEEEGTIPLYGFLSNGDEGLPHSFYDAATEDYVEGAFMAELATHLVDGWVAVVREVGYEKLRYLVGYTVAINSKGKSLLVDLDRIYHLAKRLGQHITPCQW